MAFSNLLVDKMKSIVVFKMNVLVMISRFPYSKDESVFSNNLQSILLMVLRREGQSCCKWDSGARNVKLVQFQNLTYTMVSANLKTMLELMFTKMAETKAESC